MELLTKILKTPEYDNAVERAKLTESMVRTVYDFVKFQRPEGEGLDGRDGNERQSLAKVVDEAIEHKSRMLSLK